MSVPVTNEAYSQQNNQLFDWAKTATPQQIEAAKQGLPIDSPLLLAIGMGVQYQQQARAPRPQAPQKTIMEQKLGEFTQTSSQGLPQVGQNQMAMQQTAQKNPMFGAGLAVAPENTEQAPAPQQMAATGGITALAHGGEVRGFYDGKIAEVKGGSGYTGNKFNLEDIVPMDDLYNTTSTDEETDDTDPMGEFDSQYASYDETGGNEVTPSAPRVSIPATIHTETPQFKPKGSAAQIAKTERSSQDQISELEALMGSTFTASDSLNSKLEERLANSNRNAGLGALVGGIGGMLSAQTPYMGQAIGAGLMSGLSSYQSGAKDEQAANKDLMALQMASKKSKLQGHREAADIILAEKAAIKAAQAATYGKMTQAQYEENLRRGTKGIEHDFNKEIESDKQVAALHNNIVMEMIKAHITPYEAQKSYIALAASMDPTGMFAASNPEKFKTMLDEAYQNLPGNTGSGLGNIGGGQPSGQALGNNISMSTPTQ